MIPAPATARPRVRCAYPNKKEALTRCDQEIERIYREAYSGNPDVEGILMGLHDWRTERKMIEAEPE
jgi:hypothetical protein